MRPLVLIALFVCGSAFAGITTNTATYIPAGGQTNFAADSFLNGVNASGRTVLNTNTLERVRKNGWINGFSISVHALGTTDNSLKLKLFRTYGFPNLGVFDFVSSASVTAGATGSNYFSITPPLQCQEGDCVGLFISGQADGSGVSINARSVASGVGYATGDLTSTGYSFSAGDSSKSLDVRVYMDAPVIAYAGDSITAGRNGMIWQPFLDQPGGIGGTISSAYPYRIGTNSLFAGQSYCNYAIGGTTWASVAGVQVPYATTNDHASLIWIMAGINDLNIFNNRTWSDVLGSLTTVRAMWPSGNPLIISEILPCSSNNSASGSDAQALTIRTWNTNLFYWCGTNNATLAKLHDVMGQTRSSTGFLDDLKTAFAQSDGIHLSDDGLTCYVTNAIPYLTEAMFPYSKFTTMAIGKAIFGP